MPALKSTLVAVAALTVSLIGVVNAQQAVFSNGFNQFNGGPRVGGVMGKQQPGSTHVQTQVDEPFNFTTMKLSQIQSTDAFTTLVHPDHPGHQVRVKKSDFCDPTVNVYTGYLDVAQGAKHMFFYFFESRRDPDTDDVMMWINGGPGCSSSLGLLMENGPCRIDMKNESTNGTIWNRYGWNNDANIFFLDQPVGVGYSYADYGEEVTNTLDAAKDVHAFISIFFETFNQFKNRRFHISGESYGGHYLPVFASEIVDQNVIAKAENRSEINLVSVLIGNGITDIYTMIPGQMEVQCGTASLDTPILSISTCVRMRQALPRCQKAIKESCIDTFDNINCGAAGNFCSNELNDPFFATGLNPYDVSKPCGDNSLCYDEEGAITSFLNNETNRALLGGESPISFSACSDPLFANFNADLDMYAQPTNQYLAELLARHVDVLIYVGTYDWICNWVANHMMVDRLEWAGQNEFKAAEFRDWKVEDDSEAAGITKKYGPLTFATIYGAGHMVPYDKPAEASAMLSRWLAGESL